MVEGKLIAQFISAIVLIVLLDGVVGEVDVEVGDTLPSEGELVGGSAQVPLSKQEHLQLVGHENPHSDVELPSPEKQRALHILLDHKGT